MQVTLRFLEMLRQGLGEAPALEPAKSHQDISAALWAASGTALLL
jgi:hypothetical protein